MIQRPPNPVALILLQQAWRLRLQIAGFQDLENPDDPDGPMRHGLSLQVAFRDEGFDGNEIPDQPEAAARAAYYRRLAIESHRTPPPRTKHRAIVSGFGRVTPMHRAKAKDRKILRLLAEGVPIRPKNGKPGIMSILHVGQGRVYRLLAKINARIERETRHGKANG